MIPRPDEVGLATAGPGPTSRRHFADELSKLIGDRQLIWFGIRGEDSLPLIALRQFSSSYSLTAAAHIPGLKTSIAVEEATGVRVDLDTYEIDEDQDDCLSNLRAHMLGALRQPTVLVPYRPSHFLAALHFPNLDTVTYAGLFKEQQLPFEFKPWVETQVARLRVPAVPWRYVAEERHLELEVDRPLILRPNRGSGGVGLVRVDDVRQLARAWPSQPEAFVSVAHFLSPTLPLNIGACVFPDGSVTLHPLSVQLIGVVECTDRPFGYCGNDFARAKDLPEAVVVEVERISTIIGRWLGSVGFVGAFGLDFLVVNGWPLFSEINPRFQGSSALSAELSRRMDLPDIYLDHLAAHLGIWPGRRPSLVALLDDQPRLSQVVVHHQGEGDAIAPTVVSPKEWPAGLSEIQLVPEPGLRIRPGGVLARLQFDRAVTLDGSALSSSAAAAVLNIISTFTREAVA